MPPAPASDADGLLARAQAILTALDEHIERRAEELAEPLIEAAAENARQLVDRVESSAQAEIGRLQDVLAELRRRLAAYDRHQEQMDGYLDRLAVALGHDPRSGLWPAVVAEVETRLNGGGQ